MSLDRPGDPHPVLRGHVGAVEQRLELADLVARQIGGAKPRIAPDQLRQAARHRPVALG